MSNRLDIRILISACLLGSLMTACAAPTDIETDLGIEEADGVAVQALSADTSFEAKPPTKELSRDWVRWQSALPYSTGPVADTTGEKCAMGQDGPVWFLAGTYGGDVTRECTIPAGKELFFPLINRWAVAPPEYYTTRPSLKEVLPSVLNWFERSRQHTCTLILRIDGEDVFAGGFEEMFEDLYVEVPNLYEIYLNPADNSYTPWGIAVGGPMLAIGAGHYVRIQHLSPGDHVLELGGSTCDGDTVWFETAATYYLHVE